MVAYALAKSSFYLNLPLYHYDTTRESSICHTATREVLIESIEARKKAYARVEEICGEGAFKKPLDERASARVEDIAISGRKCRTSSEFILCGTLLSSSLQSSKLLTLN